MTYAVGSTILATDINSWLTTVNNVYAVGNGDHGYGQTSLPVNVAAGLPITSVQWTNLRTMISTCATHQGTSQTNLVPASALATGQTIYAETSSTAPHNYDIGTTVTAVDTNRLNASTDMTLSSNVVSSTQTTAWSTSINGTLSVTFTSEDHARYFFNTGGQLRVRFTATGAISTSSAAQDVDWVSTIGKVGTITLSARTTTTSGTVGTIQNGGGGSQGFYGLNGTMTTIYNGTNIGGGAYSANDVLVQAQVLNVAGVNGGNGTVVQFQVILNDDHTNTYYDSVSAGLTVNMDSYKVNTTVLPVAIVAPTFAVVSAL